MFAAFLRTSVSSSAVPSSMSSQADKHRYAAWRSLRRKSTNALSAGRIWRRLG
jgi:hypothetical protein